MVLCAKMFIHESSMNDHSTSIIMKLTCNIKRTSGPKQTHHFSMVSNCKTPYWLSWIKLREFGPFHVLQLWTKWWFKNIIVNYTMRFGIKTGGYLYHIHRIIEYVLLLNPTHKYINVYKITYSVMIRKCFRWIRRVYKLAKNMIN